MSTVSKLDSSISYDAILKDSEIDPHDDDGIERFLYKINIFGLQYYIAIGNKDTHNDNKEISFYRVYLIYNKKVITKIGVYEEIVDDDSQEESKENSTKDKFENLDLLINNKYIDKPHELEDWNIKNNENENENENKNENENNQDSIINIGETIVFKKIKYNDNYDVIKTITDNGNRFVYNTPQSAKNFKNIINTLANILINKIFKKDKPFYLKPKVLTNYFINSFVYKQSVDPIDTKKKNIEILLPNIILSNKYKLNIYFLYFFEYLLNIKFIVIDENNKIEYINLFENNENIKKIDVKDKRTSSAVIDGFDVDNFNPDDVIFVKKMSEMIDIDPADPTMKINIYSIVNYKDKSINKLEDLDDELKQLIKRLLSTTNYEYNSNMLINLKNAVDFTEFKTGLSTVSEKSASSEESKPKIKTKIKTKVKPSLKKVSEETPHVEESQTGVEESKTNVEAQASVEETPVVEESKKSKKKISIKRKKTASKKDNETK